MVNPLIWCSEHDVSVCFSEHGGTLLMSWRSWFEPMKMVFYVRNLALAAVELAWKPEAGPRPGGGDPEAEGGNPGPGGRNLEAGSWTNLFMEYFSPTVYARDSLGYLETSLFPFPALRGGVIRMYIRAPDIL
ncbi:hypothetical protein F2Q69_00035276 [Brassica cretica]|uniref:Uncharacterized protein n=1 Tax=Brassica cretica TaxID=69181 RepID=A0A8S9SKL7_BRACR|nr:hypothetical protein F2Q69_00035276 [Brassica cretica]